ncbi:hypothetical protein NL676_008046 [Syzygium grande]|nr:hypothetical protein NL676_008046 [Syzygium grande]
MDKDRAGEEIIPEGDISDQIVFGPTEVIVENMDKHKVGGKIIPDGQRYELPPLAHSFSSAAPPPSIAASQSTFSHPHRAR